MSVTNLKKNESLKAEGETTTQNPQINSFKIEAKLKRPTTAKWSLLQTDKKKGFTVSSDAEGEAKYDDFVIKGSKTLTLRAPQDSKTKYVFRWEYQKLVLGSGISGSSSKNSDIFPELDVWIYQGFTNGKPDSDGAEFVFCGEATNDILRSCYILVQDLEKRIAGASSDISILCQADFESLENPTPGSRPFPFEVWKSDGERMKFEELEKKRNDFKSAAKTRTSSVDLNLWVKTIHGLAMNAQRKPSGQYEVLSRFWDAVVKVPDDLVFTIIISHAMLSTSEHWAALQNPSDEPFLKRVKNLIVGKIKASQITDRLQKLKLKLSSLTFEVELTAQGAGLKGHQVQPNQMKIGAHPNGLYLLTATREPFQRLIKMTGGKLYMPPLQYQHKDLEDREKAFKKEVEKIVTLVKRVKALPGNHQVPILARETYGTITNVNEIKVDSTTGKKRHVTQNAVMGNNSATQIMKKLFKAAPEEEILGEWLHRSARSFGGLNQGITEMSLESTQSIDNLVLGTPQTNTKMLRYELFIKRFVSKAIIVENIDEMVEEKKVQMRVATRLFHGTGKDHKHNRYGSSLWFGHFLIYWYRSLGATKPPCEQCLTFRPFSRQTPMRLEIELDIIMEELFYGWKDTTLGIEDLAVEREPLDDQITAEQITVVVKPKNKAIGLDTGPGAIPVGMQEEVTCDSFPTTSGIDGVPLIAIGEIDINVEDEKDATMVNDLVALADGLVISVDAEEDGIWDTD